MWFSWQSDLDGVANANRSPANDNRHHAIAEQLRTGFGFERHRSAQALLKLVDLRTRIAKSGKRNDHVVTKTQGRTNGKLTEIKATGGEVFPERSERDIETIGPQFLVQFAGDEVHLTEVGAARIFLLAAQVLRRRTGMRVTFNANTREEDGFGDRWFREVVPAVAMQAGHCSFERVGHGNSLPGSDSVEVGEFHDSSFQRRKCFGGQKETPEHRAVFETPSIEPVGKAGIGMSEDHSPRTVVGNLGLHTIE